MMDLLVYLMLPMGVYFMLMLVRDLVIKAAELILDW